MPIQALPVEVANDLLVGMVGSTHTLGLVKRGASGTAPVPTQVLVEDLVPNS